MDLKIVSVPEKSSIPRESAGKLLFDRLNTFEKDSVALVRIDVIADETYTYGDLIDYSTNLASNLQGIFGIKQNDMIAIISENSCKFWAAALAGLYLATPFHLLNPGYTIYELKKFLMMSQPILIFCSKSCVDKIKTLQKDLDFIKTVILFDRDGDKSTVLYRDLIKNCYQNFEINTDFDIVTQVALICNSSGTSGLPKGVMITHENVRLNLSQSEDRDLYTRASHPCIIQVIPFYHVFGFTVTYSVFYLGAKVLIMDQFQPQIYLENIQKHRVNNLFIVPSLVNFLIKSPMVDKYDLSSIEEIFTGAGMLTEETEAALRKKFNCKPIRQNYGLTELGSAIFMTPCSGAKPGSTGKLTPGHQVKIVDTKTGEILGPNQPGEICIKGAAMKGYLNDPEKTRETIDSDGFVHSGDVGYYDENKHFYIIDRLKDLIKYKSFQVPPLEIEEILLQISEVKDAAVVGKPDERYGELPVAFIVKREGARISEGEIVDYVAERLCVEKRLHGGVRFVGEIPRSSIGKILRKQLREAI